MLKFALFSVAAMTAAALQPSMLHEQVREAVQTALQTPLLLKSVMSSLHQRRLTSPEPPPENIGDGDVACVRANNTLTALAGPRGTCPMPDALNSTRDKLDIFCSSNCAENISVAIQSVSDNCNLSEYNTNRFKKFHMLTNFICGKTSNEAAAPYCFEGLKQSLTAATYAMKKSADDLTALEREQAVNGLHFICASTCKTSIMTILGKEKESVIDAMCTTNPAGDYCIFDIVDMVADMQDNDVLEMLNTGVFCTDCFKRLLPPLFALKPPSERVRNTMNVISGDLACSRPNNGPSCMFRFATEIAKLEDEEGSDTTTIAPDDTPGNCTSAYKKFLALAFSVDFSVDCFDENATQCPAACQDPITAFVDACKDNVMKGFTISAEEFMGKTVVKNPVCVWTVKEGSDTTTSAPTIAPELTPRNCTSAYTKFLALVLSVNACYDENATQCPAACQDPITAYVGAACKDDVNGIAYIAAKVFKNPVCVWTAGSSGDSSSGDSSSGDSSSGDSSSGDSSSGDSSSGDSSSGDSSSGDSSSAPGGSSSGDTGGGSSSADAGGGSSSASSLKVTMCGIATHGECRAGHTQAGVDFLTGCNTETVTESCSNPASQLTYGMKLSAGASSDSATLEYYADANSNCTGTATYTLPINTTCSVQGPWALEICHQDCVNNTVNNSFNNASDNTATGENTTTGDNALTRRRRLKTPPTNEELCRVAATLQSCCAEMVSKFAEMNRHSFDARNCPNVPAQSCTNSWDSSVAITFPTGLRANIGSAFADEVTKATILEGIRNDIAIQLGVNVTTIDITSSSFDDATGLLSLDYIVVSGQDSYGLAANAKNNQLDLANMLGALSAEVPTLDLSGVDLNTIQSEFTGTDPGERPPNPTDSNNTISNVTVTSEPPNPTDSDNTVAGAAALAVAPLAIALSFAL